MISMDRGDRQVIMFEGVVSTLEQMTGQELKKLRSSLGRGFLQLSAKPSTLLAIMRNIVTISGSPAAQQIKLEPVRNLNQLALQIRDVGRALASGVYVEGCQQAWYDERGFLYVLQVIGHSLHDHEKDGYNCTGFGNFARFFVKAAHEPFMQRAFKPNLSEAEFQQLVKEAQVLDQLAVQHDLGHPWFFFPANQAQAERVRATKGINENLKSALSRKIQETGSVILSDDDLDQAFRQAQEEIEVIHDWQKSLLSVGLNPLLQHLGVDPDKVNAKFESLVIPELNSGKPLVAIIDTVPDGLRILIRAEQPENGSSLIEMIARALLGNQPDGPKG